MSENSKLRFCVEISVATFTPFGVTLIIPTTFSGPFIFPLCEGWVGEFERVTPASPVFVMRRVRPANDQDRHQSVYVALLKNEWVTRHAD